MSSVAMAVTKTARKQENTKGKELTSPHNSHTSPASYAPVLHLPQATSWDPQQNRPPNKQHTGHYSFPFRCFDRALMALLEVALLNIFPLRVKTAGSPIPFKIPSTFWLDSQTVEPSVEQCGMP
eukprot:4449962-Amphidinium_carterae.1